MEHWCHIHTNHGKMKENETVIKKQKTLNVYSIFTINFLSEVLSVTDTPTKSTNRMSPTLNQESSFGDRQFMVITSEKQSRIVALPSQNCVYRLQITETDFIVRAEIISMKGRIFILCFICMLLMYPLLKS